MSGRVITVPDLGDFDQVEIIEVLVKPGDTIDAEQGLVTVESEKASMDVPSPQAGRVEKVLVQVGDKISAGSELVVLAAENGAAEQAGDAGGPSADGQSADGQSADGPGANAADEPAADDAHGQDAAKSGEIAASEASSAATDEKPSAKPETSARTAARSQSSTQDRSFAANAADREPADHKATLVVLGAGPGGYTAAFRAADLGLDVILVERWDTLGGVCLNVGCIPSKALLHAARVIEEAESFAEHGLSFGPPQIDGEKLYAWQRSVVQKLVGGLAGLARQRKVKVVRGSGRFLNPHQLEVAGPDGRSVVEFEQCIVAAGSESISLPGWPQDPRILDSTAALDIRKLPKSLLVVGGGVIGLEMGTVYDALGVKVSVVELTGELIPGADRDLVRPLAKRLEARWEQVLLNTKVTGVDALKKGLKVSFEGEAAPETQTYDRVLVAIGRRPNGKLIEADKAGVQIDERGFIRVDKQMRTSVPHIFAVGDIAGPPLLAHKAVHEGKVAAEVAAGHKSAFDARVIPAVAYTDPEVAWVGFTENEAKASGTPYEKGSFPWAANGRSLAMGRDDGLTKLLFDPTTRRVIGGGAVGPNAGDLISEIALAIEMGADAADVGLTIHPHPTLSETVAMSAEAFEGTLTDLMPPKRK